MIIIYHFNRKSLHNSTGIRPQLLSTTRIKMNLQYSNQSTSLMSLYHQFLLDYLRCYDLSQVLSKRHTLVLSNIKELDRELHTETSTLYTKLQQSMLLLPQPCQDHRKWTQFLFISFSFFLFSFLSYSLFVLFLVCRIRISDSRDYMIQRGFQKNDIIPHGNLMANT